MTSSLVGSEMCIRDRPIAPPASVSPVSRVGPVATGIAASTGPIPIGGTVSYTHLTLPTICSV
eukprot:4365674-Prorocentrum_lima.AAC.1